MPAVRQPPEAGLRLPEEPRIGSPDPERSGSDQVDDRYPGVTLRPVGSIAPFRRDPSQWIEEGLPERPPRIVQPKQRIFLSSVLFLLTVASTSYFVSPTYSVCLMAILTAHEFGHYLAARYYRVPATLPYFLPAPFLFGTMGAVIRMSPFIPNRKALFDISAAGPLAGVVLAIPISWVGVALSSRLPVEGTSNLVLGEPLLFKFFEWTWFGAPEEGLTLMLHDVGFAGWVGLFITALNLIPVGQLDGGHICYAVFEKRSFKVAVGAFLVLVAISIATRATYALLLVLLFVTGIRHVPTMDDSVPIGRGRQRIAALLLIIFALCFVPVPISIGE